MKKAGKLKLFNKILSDYHYKIRQTCKRYTDTHEEYCDLYQEVWINIWTGLDRLRNPEALASWTFRLTKHTAMDYLRKKKKYILHSNRNFESLEMAHLPQDTEYIFMELTSLLFEAIDKLSSTDRIIVLSLLQSKSYREISEITGLSNINLRVRYCRLKEKLKDHMTKSNTDCHALYLSMVS